MRWFDTHCHLNHEDFASDLDVVLARTRAAGVERCLVVGWDRPSSEAAVRLAEREAGLFAAVGFHPSEAGRVTEEDLHWLKEQLDHPAVVAVGEIGVDLHWEKENRSLQVELFRRQLELSAEAGLPVVVHQREAVAEVLGVLEAEPVPGILHCFTGDVAEVERVLGLPVLLGFGGAVTFRRNERLRDAARAVPADRLVLETDAPYLSPEPWRGRRNEPARVVTVAETVAAVRGIALEELAQLTWGNANRLFGRSPTVSEGEG